MAKGGWIMNFDYKQFYLSAQGRVSRKQLWLRLFLPIFVIDLILIVIDLATGTYNAQYGIGLLSSLFALVMIVPSILVYIKRWHDRDKSGWWMLIAFIPIVGTLWFLIELFFLPGTVMDPRPGPNRFGPPPSEDGPADARLGGR
jgi:uncharacterized membrane protein YhaH (DUF805 family)